MDMVHMGLIPVYDINERTATTGLIEKSGGTVHTSPWSSASSIMNSEWFSRARNHSTMIVKIHAGADEEPQRECNSGKSLQKSGKE